MIYQHTNLNYEKSIFLTFDIDWAHDDVIKDTIEILAAENVKATFFITHDCDALNDLRLNRSFELGIHPNFNPLLNAEPGLKPFTQVVDHLMLLIPDAKSVRSHSLVQSSRILDYFASCGLRIDANIYIPISSGIICKPFVIWNNILRVPHFWEDDLYLLRNDIVNYDVSTFLSYEGIKVFDFHPIHVYLNTESITRYENAKPHYHNAGELIKFRNHGADGTRQFLIDLIRESKSRGLTFRTLEELLV
jgi:peptidoglycan/xylan/chitin deacetylase (PgdA/CDA1 family)